MKILISLSYYSPHTSGLTLYAKNLAEGLVRQKEKVTILTSRHAKELPLQEIMQGVHVVRVPITLKISKGPIMINLLAKSIPLIQDTDVINCHLPQFESFIIALVARMFGKKVIVTYHTDLDNEKGFGKKIIKYGLLFSHTITCLLSDAIVVQTEDNARHSSFLKQFKKKLVFIYPPVMFPSESPSTIAGELQRRIGGKDAYYIGFLGRMAREKGIDYLLEALPLIEKMVGKKCVLVIAGPEKVIGERVYQKKIEGLLETKKDSVLLLGFLPEEAKNAFYKNLDVFVLPSINKTEAFGMVQIEAMYCGTPVVATNLPGVRVPIEETGMGEVVPIKNAEALAKAVSTVLQQRKKYIKEKQVIQEIFSMEKIINAYQKVLNLS